MVRRWQPVSEHVDKRKKRAPLTLRTTKERRRELERAAAQSGRSLVQEVEYRVDLGSWLIGHMAGGGIGLEDLAHFLRWAEFLQTTVILEGESVEYWRDYAVPFSLRLDTPPGRILANELVADAIERKYQESKAFIAEHGEPLRGRKLFPGTAGAEGRIAEMVTHLEHWQRVQRIEANRRGAVVKGN